MRIHFIAIGGSAMHNLAIALAKKGYQVTGSDDAIFEPSSSRLKAHNLLPKTMGWNEDNITPDLDAVILGMHARADNPELLKAQSLGLKIYSYPEYIYEQSKQKLRVVVGGSHGKTTITSMIMHVLHVLNRDFDYMVGAQLEGFDTMVRLTDEAPLIVIEGDEYLSSPIDHRPKFHLYKADIGVISGIAWDHINVFPTFENYVQQFQIFIATINQNGYLVYNEEDNIVNKVVSDFEDKVKKIAYHSPQNTIRNGRTYISSNGQDYPLKVFGKHNLQNIEAAHQVCRLLSISDEEFYKAISSFKGAARRLELLAENSFTAVYKDFAHSPSKLKATVEAVKKQFPERELTAVIELHTFSSLNENFLNEYSGSMDIADIPVVFIDKRTFELKKMPEYHESVVLKAFGNKKLKFFNDPEILDGFLSSINYKGKNLLLMSSGNFGGLNLKEIAEKIVHKN